MKKLMGIGSNANLANFNFGSRLIATFGDARLIRHPDGRHELQGGSAADGVAAREWCSFFAPEVVFSAPRRTSPAARADKKQWQTSGN